MSNRRVIRTESLLVMSLCMVSAAGAQEQKQKAESPLRVVIAGMVHGHVDGFLSEVVKRNDVEIAAVAEPNRALFDQYAKKYTLDAKLYRASLEEALIATKPEAVLIYSNTFDHRNMVEICARYSNEHPPKPLTVMMEKPLAVSADDAYAIDQAATDSKMTVLVNYWTTWEPSRRAAYEMARGAGLGGVRKMVAHDGHKGPKEIGVGPEFLGWLTDPKLNGGGALYDFGCYGVDFMTWLMDGQRPTTVTAVTLQIKPEVYPRVDDDATIVLTYPKAVGIVQGSWNWPFSRSDVEIYGKTGELKTTGRNTLEVRREGEAAAKTVQTPALVPPEDDELQYLLAVARDNRIPDGPGTLAVNVVVAEVLDAARRSAQTGTTVKILRRVNVHTN